MTDIQHGNLRDGTDMGDLMSIHTSLEVWKVEKSQVNSLKFHLKKKPQINKNPTLTNKKTPKVNIKRKQ